MQQIAGIDDCRPQRLDKKFRLLDRDTALVAAAARARGPKGRSKSVEEKGNASEPQRFKRRPGLP
jgi:hypothetical protein